MQIKESYEIKVAWIKLLPELKQFTRGSDIKDDWVLQVGGVVPDRMEPRLKRHFLELGIESGRRGPMLHLYTEEEQYELGKDRQKKSNKTDCRALRAFGFIDRAKLAPERQRQLDFRMHYLQSRIDSFSDHKRQVKAVMGAPVPNILKAGS
jgi:hypothetical protein